MEMVVVVHPTLEEYLDRVQGMAAKYGCDNWLELSPDTMNEEDGHEFSFIQMAVGDQLIHRELFATSESPGEYNFAQGLSTEPGIIPGSVVYTGVALECHGVRRPY